MNSEQTMLIKNQTLHWIRSFIIQYNLCPFAKGVVNKGTLRIQISNAMHENNALEELMSEILFLEANPSTETTLLVFSNAFKTFYAYLDYVALAEQLLTLQGYEGIYQIATFHPDYCFAGTPPDDASNYTNRSPYPMLHLIKEESLDNAIAAFGNTDKIPERNIACMQQLGVEKIKLLFAQCLSDKK